MELLEKDGSFNFVQRDPTSLPERLENMATFWLIGRSSTGIDHNNQQNGIGHDKDN